MFGIINGCGLAPAHHSAWTAHYCGLCLALKIHHGTPARLTVNGDAVLLSLLCEAQSPARFPRRRLRCPFHRFRSVNIVSPDTPGLRFAAAVSVLMGAARIDDHIADRETFLQYLPGFFTRLSAQWHRSGSRAVRQLAFNPASIFAEPAELARRERQPGRPFLFYAHPTETAGAAVCAHTATLAGRPENRPQLTQVGRMYGRIIYLLDSYKDYHRDRQTGRFNALAQSVAPEHLPSSAMALFQQAVHELRQAFSVLRLSFPDPVTPLMTVQLPETGKTSFGAVPDPSVPGNNDPAFRERMAGLFRCDRTKRSCRKCGDCCDCGDGWECCTCDCGGNACSSCDSCGCGDGCFCDCG